MAGMPAARVAADPKKMVVVAGRTGVAAAVVAIAEAELNEAAAVRTLLDAGEVLFTWGGGEGPLVSLRCC